MLLAITNKPPEMPQLAALVAAAFLLVGASPAGAQEADTLDAARYLPLEIGNVWEYKRVAYRPRSPLRDVDSSFVNYERYAIIGTETIGDTVFHRLDLQIRDQDGTFLQRDTSLIRYDASTGGMDARGNAGIFADIACLDAAIGENYGVDCPYVVTLHEGDFIPLFDDEQTRWFKQYFSFGFEYILAHEIGPVMFGPVCEGCSVMSDDDGWALIYARVDGVEYGQAVVSVESPMRIPMVPTLQVYPNPASDHVNVSAASNRLDVFDLLGRRVAEVKVAAGDRIRLDVSTWPRGAYIVYSGEQSRVLIVR
jgi:hypothetical protein